MPSYKIKQIMHIARLVRDTKMHVACKATLINGLHKLFEEDNPMYDAVKFKSIATGTTNETDMNNFFRLRKIPL